MKKKADWREANREAINEKNKAYMAKKRALEKPAKDAEKTKTNAIKEIVLDKSLSEEEKLKQLSEL